MPSRHERSWCLDLARRIICKSFSFDAFDAFDAFRTGSASLLPTAQRSQVVDANPEKPWRAESPRRCDLLCGGRPEPRMEPHCTTEYPAYFSMPKVKAMATSPGFVSHHAAEKRDSKHHQLQCNHQQLQQRITVALGIAFVSCHAHSEGVQRCHQLQRNHHIV